MHPGLKHWHLLHYVLVRKRDLRDVLHTRVMPSAECHTGHRLVRCKLRLQFKPKQKKKGNPKKKLNVPRQFQEKCREQNMGLYATFIDLTKAFDTVSRTGLWLILERLRCPPKFLQMVIQLHENQRGQVRLNGDLSEPFPISNSVKQGCVLAPTLFSIFFTMMLKQATADLEDDEGVYVRYRLNGSLFNLRRLQAHTKTQERLIQNLLFADDAALVAHTERALQCMTSCFADVWRLFGLEVSLKKTEVLHQPTPHEENRPPHISIGDTELKSTLQFTYLGCTISFDAKIDKAIDNSSTAPSVQTSLEQQMSEMQNKNPCL